MGTLSCAPLATGASADADPGDLVRTYCLPCHGSGDTEFYPTLENAAGQLTGLGLASVILNGKFDRAGERQGQTVPIMPAHVRLANESIARIVNHLKGYPQGSAEQISAEDVAAIRGEVAEREVQPLSKGEHARGTRLYHTHCAGCHGVDRRGRAGSALYAWSMQQHGTMAIMGTLHQGSSWGMPSWLQQGLNEEDLELIARYVQTDDANLPRFEWQQVKRSWQAVASQQRSSPTKRSLFVSLLHDTGEIALIDAQNYTLVKVLNTGLAPHAIRVSDDQCLIHVLNRAAEVSTVDACADSPQVIAHVKTGYEGRTMALGLGGNTLLVASNWPPHVISLNAQTLRPKRLIQLDPDAYATNATTADVAQILPLNRREALVVAKTAGELLVLNRRRITGRESGSEHLRTGSPTHSGAHLIAPTDDAKLVVYSLEEHETQRIIFVEGLAGGAKGTAFTSNDNTYWVTGGMSPQAPLVRVQTDGPPRDWRIERLDYGGDGSLNVATHPAAGHIWIDHPLADTKVRSQSITVVAKDEWQTERVLPVVEWAQLNDVRYARALHPQFSEDGREAWITVWNRQDLDSAIVVVDTATLEPKHVIKGNWLTTPIRTFRAY